LIDRSSVDDLVRLGLYCGLAVAGVVVTENPLGALVGPLGLKLVLTENNAIAQGSGAITLAALGFLGLPRDVQSAASVGGIGYLLGLTG
jgi:hypothetical protein